ncbi:GNAT family N-acetyltransferase [Streptomyces cacaoi]|uniref:GNAT family N-acetyltransferase n=1 Tax=Streptomyces cacaoi TaxID=1898 RepID=UPI0037481693
MESTQSARFRMTVNLSKRSTRSLESEFPNPINDDIPALGELMLAAYRGTPNEADAGQTVESATAEITRVFDGEYGHPMLEASFVARNGNTPVAVTLVTSWRGEPLLAYVFTAPSHTGHGLARSLIEASMNALAVQGHDRLNLAVTEDNPRAWKLYEIIGFQRFIAN